jgi:hypothetical protein
MRWMGEGRRPDQMMAIEGEKASLLVLDQGARQTAVYSRPRHGIGAKSHLSA